jgi:[protein-PII] uridylyltransferase
MARSAAALESFKALRAKRAIVDRRRLMERIEGVVGDRRPDTPTTRAAVLAVLKDAMAHGRDEIRVRLEAGVGGSEVTQAHCFLVDQVVRALFDFVTGRVCRAANPTAAERVSLVALGGYGRGELAPYSDVDLMFLLPWKQTAWGEQVVEHMLYQLWDLGLKVGHSTRSIDEAIRLARSDLTIRTALLEARYVWGDQALFLELKDRFSREIVAGTGPDFTEAKLAERDERHQRMGDSRYVLEPNVKDGKGGLRDLHTLYWIAKYLYRVESLPALVEHGVLTQREARTFQRCEAFLRTVRCWLHALAGRPEERLTFDLQPELARRLGYTDHAGTSGVERFMKHYFLVAKEVGDLTRIFCAALEEQHKRRKKSFLPRLGLRKREVEGFLIEGDRINVAAPDDFRKDPIKLIRLFHVAHERGLDIHPNAVREITRNLRLIDRRLREDAEANRLFMEILASRKDPEIILRRMNETGVFGRFVPDFGRVVAQMQHDMYHVYTVDEHTIRAIGILARIESGELKNDHPLSAEIIHKLQMRRVLYLAVLLHDIAKGRGGDHSVLGEKVAEELGPRLGLEPAETETVAWLVRWHLAMSSTAFKRDLDDPKTILDFVALVQSPERLKLLLILTTVDIRAVGPGVFNGWKGQLLRELYNRAEEAMGGRLEARGQRVAAAKDALRERLADWPADAIEAHLGRPPDSFWLSTDLDTQERLARLMREADRNEAPLTVDTRVSRFQAVTEVTIYTADHPGLFSRLSGAMATSGASIVDARIFTTSDGMALDVFWIQDADGKAFDRPDRLARLSTAIEQTLSGRLKLHEELPKRRGKLPVRAEVFRVEPQVLIDNTASNTHTVVEVVGRDRPALLYDLTRQLFRLSLSISHARIATYGERAVDVFYVKDLFGLKVTQQGKLDAIRQRLREVLKEPPASAGARSARRAAQPVAP